MAAAAVAEKFPTVLDSGASLFLVGEETLSKRTIRDADTSGPSMSLAMWDSGAQRQDGNAPPRRAQ
eukprot:12825625-Heterocapsa_arctica.AAC.1